VEKFSSFGFAEGLALCCGAKPNVLNVGGLKTSIFFVRGKNKNTEVGAVS
jgi:hypothetical protein